MWWLCWCDAGLDVLRFKADHICVERCLAMHKSTNNYLETMGCYNWWYAEFLKVRLLSPTFVWDQQDLGVSYCCLSINRKYRFHFTRTSSFSFKLFLILNCCPRNENRAPSFARVPTYAEKSELTKGSGHSDLRKYKAWLWNLLAFALGTGVFSCRPWQWEPGWQSGATSISFSFQV